MPLDLFLSGLVVIRRLKGGHLKKSPRTRKALRYPGYTLSKKLEDLDLRLSSLLAGLFVTPSFFTIIAATEMISTDTVSGAAVFWLSSATIVGAPVSLVYWTSGEIRITRAGLVGEQIVGFALTELASAGFRVFHDYPYDYGNIAHILVGPAGVYTVETKYCRQPSKTTGHCEIRYDGNRIHFPDLKKISAPIRQSRLQARELEKILEPILPNVQVQPIVVPLSRYVAKESQVVEVQVLNESQVTNWLEKKPGQLSSKEVQTIETIIHGRCCDVET